MKLPLEVNYSREYWGNEFVFEWTDGHDLTFFRVEIHVVLLGPLRNAIDVVLQR